MFNKIKSGLSKAGTWIKNKVVQINGRLTGQKRIGTTRTVKGTG